MKYTKPTLAPVDKVVVISVVRQSLLEETQGSLECFRPDYVDSSQPSLEEDLYGEEIISKCLNQIDKRRKEAKTVIGELKWIQKEMNKAGAAYVRFVKM